MKLFRVKLKGMTFSSTGAPHGDCYVIANDPTEAYKALREFLNEKDYGFLHERELDTIELLADEYEFSDVRRHLIIIPQNK